MSSKNTDSVPAEENPARPVDHERHSVGRSAAASAVSGGPLLAAGLALGVVGDWLLRAPGAPGLNIFVWILLVALGALLLHRRAGLELDRERGAWLAIGVLLAAGVVWRDSPALKLLALGCATLAFALAAYRATAVWVRHAGVTRYARAWGTGALHAWTAAAGTVIDAIRSASGPGTARGVGLRRATSILRGLLIAAPLVVVFGALFMSADEVFSDMVLKVVRVDLEKLASHVLLFSLAAWLATGYIRGFLLGTELPPLRDIWRDSGRFAIVRRPALSITEVATALAVLDLLFLSFVIIQFRYLFGGDTLIQITPDLTYAEYARRGFLELVLAVALVVPVLLAADWLLVRVRSRDNIVFRTLAGVQIVLVLAIAASALQRLRLYHASYGLTESRFYALALLIWIGAMLLWFGASVLRDRREAFAFGALASGLAAVVLLFLVNPDATIARANLARLEEAGTSARFDAAYAASLSADAVPVLIEAMPALPNDMQCPLARHILLHWAPDGERSIRGWNWSASRARDMVREHEALLRSMLGPGERCATRVSG